MSSKDEQYEKWLWERIEEQIPKISKREARFRQVDKIPALGAFMKAHESECEECSLYRKEIESVVSNLPQILNGKGAELERDMEVWKTHLRKKYNVYPEFYFNYRYSTYSFFIGLLLGIVASYLFNGEILFSVVGLCCMGFLIVGFVYGSYLDAKQKESGRGY